MKFKTTTGFVTVVIGDKTIKVNIHDPHLSENSFCGYTETLESKAACLHIDKRSECFAHAAGRVGIINDGPEPPATLPRMLRFKRLSVKFPNGETRLITRPNHPLVFDLLQFTDVIEAQAITIRVHLNNETAEWYGHAILFPYKPPVEEPTTIVPVDTTPIEPSVDSSPMPEPEPEPLIAGLTNEVVDSLTICWEEVEMTKRLANCLHLADYRFIFQAAERTESEMLKVKNLGKKTLVEIKEILSEFGLHLGMNLKPEQRKSLFALADIREHRLPQRPKLE